jgi:hypothetical protein
MIAWDKMGTDELALEKLAITGSASLIYRLMVAFPSWGGAMLAGYAIFPRLGVTMSNVFRIRPRSMRDPG